MYAHMYKLASDSLNPLCYVSLLKYMDCIEAPLLAQEQELVDLGPTNPCGVNIKLTKNYSMFLPINKKSIYYSLQVLM